jgi:hypothetical protein
MIHVPKGGCGMQEGYSKKDVAAITGVPYRNIQFYTEQGVVTPEIDEAGGRGKFRRYSDRDLVSFIVAGELGYYGMTVSEIKKTVLVLRHFWSLPVDLPSKGKPKQHPGILTTLSRISVTLRIGKTSDRTKVTQLTFGVDEKGMCMVVFSIVTSPEGKTILHLRDNQERDGGPYVVTMDENQKKIENYDLDALLKEGLVSFVFISIDELISEALKRMP